MKIDIICAGREREVVNDKKPLQLDIALRVGLRGVR